MTKNLNTGLLIFFFTLSLTFNGLFLPGQNPVQAQELNTQYQGVVTRVVSQEDVVEEGNKGIIQTLEVRMEEGPDAGKLVTVVHDTLNEPKKKSYQAGDELYFAKMLAEYVPGDSAAGNSATSAAPAESQTQYLVLDEVRQPAIYLLIAIFALLTILIAGKKGILSLIGLGLSFAILLVIVLPLLLQGVPTMLVVLPASVLIVLVNFYISHGVSKKTNVAIVGTIAALVLTGILSVIFIDLAKLSGFATEEAVFLASIKGQSINIQSLLLAGVILGAVGILDDITISQAAIAQELKLAAPNLTVVELYKRTMKIGKDHIASIVNTLILVYTSASLPLLLLFLNSNNSFHQVLNLEIVAQEVVTTLLSSIGLILAVPITTYVAAWAFCRPDAKLERVKLP